MYVGVDIRTFVKKKAEEAGRKRKVNYTYHHKDKGYNPEFVHLPQHNQLPRILEQG